MASHWVILALAGLALGTVPAADARDKDGFLEPAENPLLGTWLLSAEGINPNMPTRCGLLRMTFTQTPRTYMQFRPNAVAAGQRVFTILDHDHIMVDEIPRCTWQRGPLNGTTPLLEQIKAEAEAKSQQAAGPSAPPPYTPPPDQPQAEAGPVTAPAPTRMSPELQQSMDQLNQAIRDLQEQARQQSGQ